ncbi:MAG: ATP-binding cassette domain-containing protein [Lachnospiraceae bacterium]|nr:ATP-binding cassette domain-containing protein [Lachnospiraceae bacterium]
MGQKMIEASDLGFTYADSEEGIREISFEIYEGEVILLTGNSGCGKSTLLKCLNGLIPEVTEGELNGHIYVLGKDREGMKMHELNREIGSVFQNPRSQFFTDNTTAELVFPMENYGYSKEEMDRHLQKLTEDFSLQGLLDRSVYELSSGERQMVALASSLTMDQKVLLFDEPSANLDYGNAMKLGCLIREMKQKGMTVIVSDHRFYYLNGIIDRVFFMESGHLRIYGSEEQFKQSGYHSRSFDIFHLDVPFRENAGSDEEVLSVEDVSYKDILKDINFNLRKGETTVIVGANGAGKTTLAKLMCRSIKPDHGKIRMKGIPFFIMQDPDYQLFGTSVHNELTLVKKDEESIKRHLEHFGLYEYRHTHPFDLSGGQKQRLQIAMTMLCDKEVILFDEPTSGLDVSSMLKVSAEIIHLSRNAATVVISHDYEFIRHVADRIIYLKNGSIAEDFRLNKENLSLLKGIFYEMQEEVK